MELADEGSHLIAGQDDRQSHGSLRSYDVVEPRHVLPQHLAIEKEKRAQRLVLGGRSDVAVHRQRAQVAGELGRAQLGWMAPAVEHDVAPHPPDVGLLRASAVMAGPQGLAHAVEKPWGVPVGWRIFSGDQEGRGWRRVRDDASHRCRQDRSPRRSPQECRRSDTAVAPPGQPLVSAGGSRPVSGTRGTRRSARRADAATAHGSPRAACPGAASGPRCGRRGRRPRRRCG